ncbi:MAG: hypothetical protein ABII01_03775 [Candidatus Woesearchaeota archaeon]
MKKRVIGLFIVLIVSSLYLGQIRQFPEYPGDPIGLHVNVVNNLRHRENDMRVEVYIYDLGLYAVSPRFDLPSNSKTSESIWLAVPENAQPGWYFTKISLMSDRKGRRDAEYRYVQVV